MTRSSPKRARAAGKSPATLPAEIVVGFDGSPAAEAAVRWAARRVAPDGHITIVFAAGLSGANDPERLKGDQPERGQAVLDALLMESDATLLDREFDLILSDEPPARAVCDLATELDAGEIVVGSHGFGRARAALGSVSHDILHRADRPVVVIPERMVPDPREASDG
jgi:nucleotide-binding universal stress UspA family protein